MRNSEESSKPQPAPSFVNSRVGAGAAREGLKHRADGSQLTALLWVVVSDVLGRVGAKIVCDDTLVQYAAYLALLFLLWGLSGWYHSIPIILVGLALHLFFSSGQCALFYLPFF
ncbi:hypothetical protein N7535_005917 [Penicillium sp. DV-2018c]|nr:hypothetical protein N7535_005917 [Penicillium sp. DV-2018c]